MIRVACVIGECDFSEIACVIRVACVIGECDFSEIACVIRVACVIWGVRFLRHSMRVGFN